MQQRLYNPGIMRTTHFVAFALMLLPMSAAAAPFRNMDFEEGQLVPLSPQQPNRLDASLALPGWTLRVGETQVIDIFYNQGSIGQPNISIWDSAVALHTFATRFQERFSVALQSDVEGSVESSIEQSGSIPATAQSIRFRSSSYALPPNIFLNGVMAPAFRLSPVPPTFDFSPTLWGVDLRAYSGSENVSLRVASHRSSGGSAYLVDEIAFCEQSIPEPSLSAIGGFTFAVMASRRHRCKGRIRNEQVSKGNSTGSDPFGPLESGEQHA